MVPFLAGEQGNNDFLCPDMSMFSNEIMFFLFVFVVVDCFSLQ